MFRGFASPLGDLDQALVELDRAYTKPLTDAPPIPVVSKYSGSEDYQNGNRPVGTKKWSGSDDSQNTDLIIDA